MCATHPSCNLYTKVFCLLKKINRLKTTTDFSKVYKKGRSYVSDLFVLYVLLTKSDEKTFGFSVSKKVGNACMRNSIKRRSSEVIRINLEQIKPGISMVFIARKNSALASYSEIDRHIKKLLSKARVIESL